MNRRWLILAVGIYLANALIGQSTLTSAAPSSQGDPAKQCAEGMRLFREQRVAEALPLLESGFASRDQATFAELSDLAACAWVLGLLRKTGNPTGALEAFAVVLEILRTTGKQSYEGKILFLIGEIYQGQGHYGLALKTYQQALAAFRAVDDQASQGVTLNNIGMIHEKQGRYVLALEMYQQALAIHQSEGNRAGEGTILNNTGVVYMNQGRYVLALEMYQQALAIHQSEGNRAGEGNTLSNIGATYSAQGQYQTALEAYQRALTIMREVGDRVSEGGTLNSLGVVYGKQGRYELALKQFDQALSIQREAGDRAGEGTTLSSIGATYQAQGRYDLALKRFDQALSIRREMGDRAGEGRTRNNIGTVYQKQGRYVRALEQFDRALSIQREMGSRDGEGIALSNIGGLYQAQGRHNLALERFDQALSIHREVGNWVGEGTTLNNIGTVYQKQGRYVRALEQFDRALSIQREVGDRAMEGTTLNNIGVIYQAQGRYRRALERLEQALAILRALGDRAMEGTTLNNIGVVYQDQGRFDLALERFEQALAIVQQVGNRAYEGELLSNIGMIYLTLRRFDLALERLDQSLAIRREVGDRAGEGTTLNNIGTVYQTQGRYELALERFEQALAIVQQVGNRAGEGIVLNNIGAVYQRRGHDSLALEKYKEALTVLREVGDRAGQATALKNIGLTYEQLDRPKLALEAYEQAMEVLAFVRAVAGSESGRATFIAQHAGLYRNAIELYDQQGQREKAFLTSERGRSRSFLDSLITGQVHLRDDAAASLLAREQTAYVARQAAQEALAQARAQEPPDRERLADLEVQLHTAQKEYEAAEAAIAAHSDQLSALVPGSHKTRELRSIQELINRQTTLVSYYVLGKKGALAFVITSDSLSTIALPQATPDALRKALDWLKSWPNLHTPAPQPLKDLHGWLIAPLHAYLHTPQVALIPHDLLHYVPFAALTNGKTYFGEQHTLFVLPSASTLPFIQANAAKTRNVKNRTAVVFGSPDTDASQQPLMYAAAEAKAVANFLGAPVYTDTDASEDRLRSLTSKAHVVHLAAHGDYNAANPLSSAMFLAPGGQHDGRLEVQEVYGLDLETTDIVVLSACNTHVGELSAGDEVVGLTRAFFFAGTPTVVASLWPVDDQATKDLIVTFYCHWRAGLSKAEALQAAQAEVRRNYPSPYYWAAFVLSGDPGKRTSQFLSLSNESCSPPDMTSADKAK